MKKTEGGFTRARKSERNKNVGRKKKEKLHSLESELKFKQENKISPIFFCHALQQVQLPSTLIIGNHYDT